MWLTKFARVSFLISSVATWSPMLGEQIDLIGLNDTMPDWTRVDTREPMDSFNATQYPLNPIDRDRELLDDVERIEPRQRPVRPVIPASPVTTAIPARRNAANPSTSAQRYPTVTAPTPTVSVDEVFCDFGSFPGQSLCEWQNGEDGALNWNAGTGLGTNWMGGPPSDFTSGTMDGGYAFIETSDPPENPKAKSPGGLLHSPQLGTTGVSGTCVMFKYSLDGLSVAGLRLLLHVGVDDYSAKKDTEEISPENVTIVSCEPGRVIEERPIWHAQYYILGTWQQAQMLYTFPELHSLVIEGIPVDTTDPSRVYRGYIALDDIDLQPGTSCVGFCNFAGGFCDWNNDAEDDFDWTISRGTINPATGPSTDSSSEKRMAGGYAYIDSGFPRRPGDTARLASANIPATGPDAPICLRFWFHMFGSGIGSLRLYLRYFRNLNAGLKEVWGLSGNAGNAWFAAQVAIGSMEDFQLVFEATVGNTGMGDIAIDDVSFTTGACPVSPQVAAPVPRDCTFEIDECEWINSRDPDRVEWERLSTQALTARNQRRPYSNTINRRNEYFLGLGRTRGPRNVGGTAQLVSREMKGSEEPLCVTFWFLMFEPFIDAAGPSLGVLRVLIQSVGEDSEELKPIWQLHNNQGPSWAFAQANINQRTDFNVIFEGTWGPNRASGTMGIDDISFYAGNCSVRPASAAVRLEDCSFEKGLCGWENITSSDDNERALTWQRAFLAHRPAQLLDKTFGATGYFVFFDIFTNNQKSTEVQLRSSVINPPSGEESICFTFWFAAFGVDESTTLEVIQVMVEENGNGGANEESQEQRPLWSLTAKGFNSPRPSWTAAQVTIDTRMPYRLILKGSTSNGGFAIDDIKFQPLSCPTRPPAAQPSNDMI